MFLLFFFLGFLVVPGHCQENSEAKSASGTSTIANATGDTGNSQAALKSQFDKARALRNEKKYEAALEIYDQIITENDFNAKAFQEKGAVLASLDRYREAISAENRAIRLDPKLHLAHIYKGMIYCNKSRNLDAYTEFSKALEIKPESYVVHMRLGLVCNQLKRLDESLQFYRKASQLKTTRSAPHMALSAVYIKKGKIDKAIEEAKLAIKLEKSAINYNNLGSIYSLINKLDEAKALLNKAIETDPKLVTSYITLGRILTLQGKFPEAKKVYETVRNISKRNKAAFIALEQLNNKSILRVVIAKSTTAWLKTDSGYRPQVTLMVKNVSGTDLSNKTIEFMVSFENLEKGRTIRARKKVKQKFSDGETISVTVGSRGKMKFPEQIEKWPEVQCTVNCRVGNVSSFDTQYILDRLMDRCINIPN